MSSIEHRVNGTGTESWRVRFRHHGANRAVTFATEHAASSFRAIVDSLGPDRALALAATPTPGHPQAVRRTVAGQVEHHIEHLTGITEGTRSKYRKIHRARIAEPFGDVLLTDLTRDHVAAWVNAQTGAAKTVRNAHGLLSAALTSATRDGLVPGNVAKGVRMPRSTREEHVYLDPPEFAVLVGLLAPHWRPLTTFLVGTGARFSEATALTFGALDLGHSSARIRQSWKDTSGGRPVLGVTKTRMSDRTIGLPPEVVAMLRIMSDGRQPTEFVFTNTRGNPVRNGVFHESAWQRVMPEFEERTGKRPRVHDLRHTYAAWALRAGVALHVVQRQMGHESIQTTVDTYGHLVRADIDVLAGHVGANLPPLRLES